MTDYADLPVEALGERGVRSRRLSCGLLGRGVVLGGCSSLEDTENERQRKLVIRLKLKGKPSVVRENRD